MRKLWAHIEKERVEYVDLASQIERTTEEGLQVEFSQWLTNQSLKGATTVQPESRLEEHTMPSNNTSLYSVVVFPTLPF